MCKMQDGGIIMLAFFLRNDKSSQVIASDFCEAICWSRCGCERLTRRPKYGLLAMTETKHKAIAIPIYWEKQSAEVITAIRN